jgi:hypothetical protein
MQALIFGYLAGIYTHHHPDTLDLLRFVSGTSAVDCKNTEQYRTNAAGGQATK